MRHIGLALAAVALVAAACSSQAPPPPPPVTVSQSLMTATPPPPVSTPVPIVKAHQVPGAGRPDPFVALFGPAQAAPPPTKPVAVSTFPQIPTLPGFGPGGQAHTVWDGVALTGVVRGQGYTAIVAVNDQSYIVRQGDSVGSMFRVVAIGPDFVTLVTTGSPAAERTFTLGG